MSARFAEFDGVTIEGAHTVEVFDGAWGCSVGEGGAIFMTDDRGAHWTAAESSGTTNDLWDFCFADNSHGWAVGAGGVIVATSDGGVRWSRQTSGTTSDLNSITCTDALHGCVRDVHGGTLVTDDGGQTWLRTDEFSTPPPNTPDPD